MHQIPKLKCFSSCLAVVFAQSIEAICEVENEDVVGAVPTGDAPTTSEWPTFLLPTKATYIRDLTVIQTNFHEISVYTLCNKSRRVQFTTRFSIVIQIWCRINFALIKIFHHWFFTSFAKFLHDMLLWLMQKTLMYNIILIRLSWQELQQNVLLFSKPNDGRSICETRAWSQGKPIKNCKWEGKTKIILYMWRRHNIFCL